MNTPNSAGESRRSRRHAFNLLLLGICALAVFVVIERGSAHGEAGEWKVADNFTRPDAEMATILLQNVQGANAVLCGAVERVFHMGNWGMNVNIDADSAADEVARWIGKDHLDRGALDVARRAFANPDACTRRVASHIAGEVDVKRLDEELRSELESSDAQVRAAAVRALGFNGEGTSLPRLQSMLQDRDRTVRLTVIWAIGRVGDEAATTTLINLLKSDPDADARRLAAYALGAIHG